MKSLPLFVLLWFIRATSVHSQEKKIENLVFEGSGIRGIGYAGAVTALERNSVLSGVKRVGGTSAGAVTALLLTLGYRSEEIEAIIGRTNFKKFNDGNLFLIGGLHRLNKYFGWYRGRRLEQWLTDIIAAKTGNANITFAQLKEAGFKDLYVTGTDLTRQQLVVFSHESFPHLKIKDAVRISVTIPFYFEPVFMDEAGNVFHHPKKKAGLRVMLDGGFVANFPIRLFDSTKYFKPDEANTFSVNPYTLGFRIDNAAQIGYDSLGKGLAPVRINRLKEYIIAFYTIVLENLNRQSLTAADWQRTVSINDGNVGPRIRRLTKHEINALTENGRAATIGYLNR